MMTIDEAIDREKEIHEANQKVVDTHVIHEDLTLEDLYCDDTEVVEEHLKNYRFASEYHEQIAEWLEELKEARKGFEENRKAGYSHGYADGYAKAIDEFAERLKAEHKQTITTSSAYCYENFDEVVDEIAEQMKKGE